MKRLSRIQSVRRNRRFEQDHVDLTLTLVFVLAFTHAHLAAVQALAIDFAVCLALNVTKNRIIQRVSSLIPRHVFDQALALAT
jgi:hypothetical protein